MSDMGNMYVLPTTEALTKYTEISVISNTEAKTVADVEVTKWIGLYGCPSILHTDGGK